MKNLDITGTWAASLLTPDAAESILMTDRFGCFPPSGPCEVPKDLIIPHPDPRFAGWPALSPFGVTLREALRALRESQS